MLLPVILTREALETPDRALIMDVAREMDTRHEMGALTNSCQAGGLRC